MLRDYFITYNMYVHYVVVGHALCDLLNILPLCGGGWIFWQTIETSGRLL
jgi:hypothetical protein